MLIGLKCMVGMNSCLSGPRKNGRSPSTAWVMELAPRLAISVASLRDLALRGLEVMRETILATLREGEASPVPPDRTATPRRPAVGEIDQRVPQRGAQFSVRLAGAPV